MQANVSSLPRASVWEWVQALLLAVNLAWTILCLGGFRAETMVVTVMLTSALVIAHVASRAFEPDPAPLHPAGWLLLPFLAYAAVNVAVVTPVRWLGWLEWIGWANGVAVFWVALNGMRSPATRRAVFFVLIAVGLGAVAMACFQRFVRADWLMLGRVRGPEFAGRASGPFGAPNSFAGFILLILPPTLALVLRREARATERIWWAWVAAVIVVGLVLTISRGAWVALGIVLVVWPLWLGRGPWRRRWRIAILVGVALVTVSAGLYAALPRVRERFVALVRESGEVTRPVMWRGAWNLFRERPWVGTGAASYNVAFERHRPERFRDEPRWAHNDYLNTLSDYGVVGFGLLFGAMAWMLRRSLAPRVTVERGRRSHSFEGAEVTTGLGMGLLAFAIHLAIEFHFRIPALVITAATLGGWVVARGWPLAPNPERRTPPRSRGGGTRMTAVIAAAAVVGTVIAFIPKLRAEGRRYAARQVMDRLGAVAFSPDAYRQTLPGVRRDLEEATRLDPKNGQAWADLAYAAQLSIHADPARAMAWARDAQQAADRAIEISSAVAEFWVRSGVAKDAQGLWQEAEKDFTAAIARAPNDATTWYYYADHLVRVFAAREAAEAALAFCLRLDPWNPAGLALRQRLAITPKAP